MTITQNQPGHLVSEYEGVSVSYDGRSIPECHETADALHRQAHQLAPRFAEEAADAGCTNYQDLKGAGPRQRKAYDLICAAHCWNELAGILEERRDAARQDRQNRLERAAQAVERAQERPRALAGIPAGNATAEAARAYNAARVAQNEAESIRTRRRALAKLVVDEAGWCELCDADEGRHISICPVVRVTDFEHVNTEQLQEEDLLVHEGMVLLLTDRKTFASSCNGGEVISFAGQVQNVAHLEAEAAQDRLDGIANSTAKFVLYFVKQDDGCWVVQGNHFATWSRLALAS